MLTISNHYLFSWLFVATPTWLAVGLIAACLALLWQQRMIIQRLEKHAESISHMDAWADDVEGVITGLEEASRRMSPTYLPVRTSAVDVGRWWKK